LASCDEIAARGIRIVHDTRGDCIGMHFMACAIDVPTCDRALGETSVPLSRHAVAAGGGGIQPSDDQRRLLGEWARALGLDPEADVGLWAVGLVSCSDDPGCPPTLEERVRLDDNY
jgi:hypothetical protein